ncbi:hypothetical protein [uncultured Umboniibacter sp.]|uniref:hypothetical protein n=1 Tax=uncultured Umboniibacter sp. TaxID=1798917 RepID=UPI002625DAE7|nr:hypothetical protein [uncultured Umboniibacter sp.]
MIRGTFAILCLFPLLSFAEEPSCTCAGVSLKDSLKHASSASVFRVTSVQTQPASLPNFPDLLHAQVELHHSFTPGLESARLLVSSVETSSCGLSIQPGDLVFALRQPNETSESMLMINQCDHSSVVTEEDFPWLSQQIQQ